MNNALLSIGRSALQNLGSTLLFAFGSRPIRAAAIAGLALGIASEEARAAEPILVPEFTPASPSEFAIAAMLGSQVQDRLLQDGHIVLTEAVVEPVIGPGLQSCAARAGCPSDVLPRLPARMAVVVMIGRAPDTSLIGYVRMFVGADARPAMSLDLPIPPGQEYLFAEQVSGAVRQLLTMVGPSPDAVLMAAARLISGQGLGPQTPPPVQPRLPPPPPVVLREDLDGPVDLDTPTDPKRPAPVAGGVADHPPAGTLDTRPLDELLNNTGVHPRHLVGSEQSFRKSGQDPRDWVYKNSPHAGRLTVDVQAGIGIGDTERGADLRATMDASGNQIETWYQEGPYYARRPRGGLFVGYSPATFMDFGLFAGVQYGNRVLTTGFARQLEDGSTEINTNQPQVLQAVQIVIQPRVRGYIVPTGPAKPYVFTAPEFRIFDNYKLEQVPNGPVYAVPPGGAMYGWAFGGGLMIDPGPIVGFFAEGAYTQLFGLRSGPAQSGVWSSPTPSAPIPTHNTIAISGGVQFRI